MIENLEVTVNNVQFITTPEGKKVHLHFRGIDPEGQINVNGYVPCTVTEYETNASVESLNSLIKTRVLERLNTTV